MIYKEYEYNRVVNERKRIKISKYPKLEDAMSSWFKQTPACQNVIIDEPTILQQAEKTQISSDTTNSKEVQDGEIVLKKELI